METVENVDRFGLISESRINPRFFLALISELSRPKTVKKVENVNKSVDEAGFSEKNSGISKVRHREEIL